MRSEKLRIESSFHFMSCHVTHKKNPKSQPPSYTFHTCNQLWNVSIYVIQSVKMHKPIFLFLFLSIWVCVCTITLCWNSLMLIADDGLEKYWMPNAYCLVLRSYLLLFTILLNYDSTVFWIWIWIGFLFISDLQP